MKPKFKVYVKNPLSHSKEEKDIYNLLTSKISGMYSRIFDSSSEIFYVYIFLANKPTTQIHWTSLSNTASYYIQLPRYKPLDVEAFTAEFRGVLGNLTISKSIDCLYVYVGNEELAETDFYSDGDDDEKNELKRIEKFKSVEPLYKLDDVIMNDDERIALLKSLAIIEHKELIFDRWNFRSVDRATKSILCFHGAPGTGKTMCAHAVAKYLGKKIILGNYNQIQSMYVGEGVKNMKACFQAAEKQDAVLFIDEADTFLSKRLPGSNENSKIYNSMSNEMFQFVESFNGCLIFASNHIEDFDPAIISRIIQPIEFKLPDQKSRVSIIKKLLPSEVPITMSEEELNSLSNAIDGFSGRDIRKSILLFLASSAYQHKTISNEKDENISMSFSELQCCFDLVRKEKTALQNKSRNTEKKLVEVALDLQKKEERLLACAANAAWANEELTSTGEFLFKELSKKYSSRINIKDRSTIISLQDISAGQLSRTERSQLLDIAVRIIAAEHNFNEKRKSFIKELFFSLGLRNNIESVYNYINSLEDIDTHWKEIQTQFCKTDYDILEDLQKEYSLGAAYYHLSQFYKVGTDLYEGIPIDSSKAEFYFGKAKEVGYNPV